MSVVIIILPPLTLSASAKLFACTEQLNAIDDALQRIEDGTYGVCEECGKKIHKERLKIMPFAKFCVACQSEMEKHAAKVKESMEEEFTYKDISIGEVEEGDENV